MRTRVHIFGASGSGTSTLGREVARRSDLPFFDADDFFWQKTDPPFQRAQDPETRQRLLMEALSADPGWVLAGSISGWGDLAIGLFDLALFVEVPTEIRLERLRAREQRRFGDRIAPSGDMHEQHRAFLDWAARYDEGGMDVRSRRLHAEWMKRLACPVLKLDGLLSFDILAGRIVAAMDA